jgi:hypothetical protein
MNGVLAEHADCWAFCFSGQWQSMIGALNENWPCQTTQINNATQRPLSRRQTSRNNSVNPFKKLFEGKMIGKRNKIR